jgi:hypothetical protein
VEERVHVKARSLLLVITLVLASLFAFPASASATAPTCVGKDRTYALATFTSSLGLNTTLRCGDSSFGWNKIYDRHKIQVMSRVTQTISVGSSTYSSPYWVFRLRYCASGSGGTACTVVRSVVGYSTAITGTKVTIGVVTTYCEGYNPACPAWINHGVTTGPA